MRIAARLRLAGRLLLLLLGSCAVAVLAFLPFAGRFFSHGDPLQHADLIIVLAGGRLDRVLEGIDLYKEGWAPRLVVSPGPLSELDARMIARGMRYPREGELARDAMESLGVPAAAITVMPGGADNTAAEAALLHRTLPAGTATSRIIVVTSTYHARRAGYAFRREFANSGIEVLVRPSRHTTANPSRWWSQRGDIRYILSELPKFVAYLAGLGE